MSDLKHQLLNTCLDPKATLVQVNHTAFGIAYPLLSILDANTAEALVDAHVGVVGQHAIFTELQRFRVMSLCDHTTSTHPVQSPIDLSLHKVLDADHKLKCRHRR